MAMATVLLGLGIIALSLPRFVTSMQSLDARSTLWDLYEGRQRLDSERLASAAADLSHVWVQQGEVEAERGLLLLRQAESVADAQVAAALRKQAAQATMSALSLAPAQPTPWARLARLRWLEGDLSGAAQALRMSFLSGAVVPSIMAWRLELGMQLRPALDQETTALLARQVRLTWMVKPDVLSALSRQAASAPFIAEAMVSLSDDELDQFSRHKVDSDR